MKQIIYLVRHGETDWNNRRLSQGHTDIPLNEAGKGQAMELRQKLSSIEFSGAYSSDLLRALVTCQIVLQGKKIDIKTTQALRERFMGPFEGKPSADFEKQIIPYTDNLTKEEYLSRRIHEQVETTAELYKRVKDFLIQQIPAHPVSSSILVATHGGVLRSVLDHLDFSPHRKIWISNCAYLQLSLQDHDLTLHGFEGITILN